MKTAAVVLLLVSQIITISVINAPPGWRGFEVSINIPSDKIFSVWFLYADGEHRSYVLLSGQAISPFASTWYFVNFPSGTFYVIVHWRDGGDYMLSDFVDVAAHPHVN